jgi:ribosomal protein S18 acetylase RimI-like enzyme
MSEINNKTGIKLLEADASHAQLLRDLGEQTFREAYEEHGDTENLELYIQRNFQLANVEADVKNTQAKYLLAQVEDQWAGYALVRQDRTHELLQNTQALMLHRIYVLQAFWRHGVGTVLLNSILDFAKQAGYEWLWLVVWEENHRALRFYEKYGFEHFGYVDFQYGDIVTKDWALRKKV